jgi:signal transduction histidine kinase
LLHEFRNRTKLEVEFKRGAMAKRLPPQVELAIYRILQEALANVEEHARARRVTVSLSADVKFATLNVIDDGVGFADMENARAGKRDRGLGIINMRERAESLGGVIDIKSAVGKGTEIAVHVKLENGK